MRENEQVLGETCRGLVIKGVLALSACLLTRSRRLETLRRANKPLLPGMRGVAFLNLSATFPRGATRLHDLGVVRFRFRFVRLVIRTLFETNPNHEHADLNNESRIQRKALRKNLRKHGDNDAFLFSWAKENARAP